MKGTAKPKPITPVVKERTFVFQLVGIGGGPLVGNFRYELFQIPTSTTHVEQTLSSQMKTIYQDAKFHITFVHENWTDPVFQLRIYVEVLQGPGINQELDGMLLL